MRHNVGFVTALALLGACLAAGVSPATAHDAPSARELVEQYVEAIGGRDAVEALRTRVAEMRVVTDLHWDRHIHKVDTLTVYGNAAGEYLVVTRTADGVVLEGFDGDEDWKIDVDGSVHGDAPMGPRDYWMTDPQFPIKLLTLFPHMRSTGAETWGGDRVWVVEIDGDESHRLGFDVETGLLTRLGCHRELLDWEVVDGVLMPRRVVYSRKGGSSTYVLDSVAHNERLDATIFSLAK